MVNVVMARGQEVTDGGHDMLEIQLPVLKARHNGQLI
jgi:hypothetical protein